MLNSVRCSLFSLPSITLRHQPELQGGVSTPDFLLSMMVALDES